jgi:DNA-binding XRE family transcriptional regulator
MITNKKNLKANTYDTNIELSNLSHNIYKKMAELGIKLPELANLIGIEYQTLWRITNTPGNYAPNLKALFPIANFFNVTISDLLKNPNLPQYVPILTLSEISTYLESIKTPDLSNHQKILCKTHIHQKAFALEFYSRYFGPKLLIKYIFKPYNKINLGNHLLFEYNDKKDCYKFAIINSIDEEKIGCTLIVDEEMMFYDKNEVKPVALAVRKLMDDDLF